MPATEGAAIAARVLADAAITALIGQRFTPDKPTQEPGGDYVIYQRQSGGDGITLSGPETSRWAEVRIEAYATTQARAEAIINAVRTRLHGWQDYAQGVQGCFARGDCDEQVIDTNWMLAGQTFAIRFQPT